MVCRSSNIPLCRRRTGRLGCSRTAEARLQSRSFGAPCARRFSDPRCQRRGGQTDSFAIRRARPFLSEGGRTNRGGPGDIGRMLEALRPLGLESLPAGERERVPGGLQQFLVARIRDWHNRQRLTFAFDSSQTSWQIVHELLSQARETGKEGPVAQYLAGAKPQLRYPRIEVQNFSFSTSDVQQGRARDFLIGNTAFHVTVARKTIRMTIGAP